MTHQWWPANGNHFLLGFFQIWITQRSIRWLKGLWCIAYQWRGSFRNQLVSYDQTDYSRDLSVVCMINHHRYVVIRLCNRPNRTSIGRIGQAANGLGVFTRQFDFVFSSVWMADRSVIRQVKRIAPVTLGHIHWLAHCVWQTVQIAVQIVSSFVSDAHWLGNARGILLNRLSLPGSQSSTLCL